MTPPHRLRPAMISQMRANARITQREALVMLGSTFRFPLEVDDDGSAYLRPTSDTTLEVHVDDGDPLHPLLLTVWHWRGADEAALARDELRTLISHTTGWTIIPTE
ncbi:hypothetical protein SAMN06295879_2739 [Agreia bicolorata]|uniref:Uncharacterized protein n=1 Tax=Agreia bicolorata TaxID=110935 RepID=A0A1T4YBW5_9MICO|nr:hypothetical protein [Agreia bicolorata]SKA99259.1 hypothetical protein SAMN06295879_2739 [Agreia bicolorata]